MPKLALHWQIIIGLLAGVVVGLIVNWAWTSETWASLGVKDAATYLDEGKRDLPSEAELAGMTQEQLDLAYPNRDAGLGAGAAKFVRTVNQFIGDLFLRGLRFIAVPIVLFSLIVGASSLNDLSKLSRIGGKTIGIYLVTTAVAITVGLLLANVIGPGNFVSEATAAQLVDRYGVEAQGKIEAAQAPDVWSTVLNIVPTNPAQALDHELVIAGERGVIRKIVETEAARLSLQLRLAFEVHSVSSMKALVARGTAASIMPWSLAATELRSGALAARRIDRPRLTRVLYLVEAANRRGFAENPALRAFLDYIAGRMLALIGPYARSLR